MKDEALKEADVLMMAESHGIDPNTKGLYGFYIDCISSQPAPPAAPVMTDEKGRPVAFWGGKSVEPIARRVKPDDTEGQP
jgi:hypothetical protein